VVEKQAPKIENVIKKTIRFLMVWSIWVKIWHCMGKSSMNFLLNIFFWFTALQFLLLLLILLLNYSF